MDSNSDLIGNDEFPRFLATADASIPHRVLRFLATVIFWILVAIVVTLLSPSLDADPEVHFDATIARTNLKAIGLALNNYHDTA